MSFEGGAALSSTLITFLLGLGIVFAGLIALIVIIKIMGAIMRGVGKKKETPVQEAKQESAAPVSEGKLGEIKAAAAAAIASVLGEGVSGIRIVSFKKVD